MMKNYAGRNDVDAELEAELTAAGIPVERYPPHALSNSEVKSGVIGILHGWVFRRAWVYWTAEGPGLPPVYATSLFDSNSRTVRVNGDCGSPSPLQAAGGFGIGLYHVDDQDGLRALADTLKRCADDALALHAPDVRPAMQPPAGRFPVGSEVWAIFHTEFKVAKAMVKAVTTWERADMPPEVSYLFEPGTPRTNGPTVGEFVFATQAEAEAEFDKWKADWLKAIRR